MNIMVTGGAGFIGSNVADAFIAAGNKVIIVDNLYMGDMKNVNKKAKFYKVDIRDTKLSGIVNKEKIDLICHHAAQISVPDSVINAAHDADINIKGLINVLDAAKDNKVKKIIFISSGGTVYGEPKKLPAAETLPMDPKTPYGISKTAGEFYVKFYAAQHNMKYTILRYSNVYGPRQIPHGEAGVVAIFIKKIMEGAVPMIFGGGICVRDYVYVGDVARANVAALTRGDNNEINIGTGKPTNVKQLFAAIKKVTGYKKEPANGPFREGDLLANYLDIKKAKKILNWKPITSLETGIKNTYAYFLNK
ncbi:MAG: NAD-dependent epimerase/dehydratase family protein [bacterium]